MQIIPQAIRCGLGRHDPDRRNARWDAERAGFLTRGYDLTREFDECLKCGRRVPEVTKLFVFLASSLAGSITGTEFTIDGGTVPVA